MGEVVLHGDAVLLDGRSTRGTASNPGCAAVAGAVLLAAGLAIPVFGFSLLVSIPDALHHVWTESPQGLYLLVGGPIVILAGGFALARSGIRNLRRQWRAAEMADRHPDQPWRADWAGDPEGTVQESAGGGAALFVVVFLSVLCAMFTAVTVQAFTTWRDSAPAFVKLFLVVVVGFWDLMLLRMINAFAGSAWRRLRHGAARLRFESFPFFLGGPLRGQVVADALAGRRGVTATLRCLEERNSRVFQAYSERRQIDDRIEPGVGVPIEFSLPAGEYGSRLTNAPLRYWELELQSPNADTIRFLLPVYPR